MNHSLSYTMQVADKSCEEKCYVEINFGKYVIAELLSRGDKSVLEWMGNDEIPSHDSVALIRTLQEAQAELEFGDPDLHKNKSQHPQQLPNVPSRSERPLRWFAFWGPLKQTAQFLCGAVQKNSSGGYSIRVVGGPFEDDFFIEIRNNESLHNGPFAILRSRGTTSVLEWLPFGLGAPKKNDPMPLILKKIEAGVQRHDSIPLLEILKKAQTELERRNPKLGVGLI